MADAAPTTQIALQALLWRMRADLEALIAEAGPTRLDTPGAAGDWTVKDVIAHLTAWRWWSVARLEAAVSGSAPTPPWPADLDEEREGDVDRINAHFHALDRDRPAAEVLRDSRATFDRLEAALLAVPEADLFMPGRYRWLGMYPAAAIVTSSAEHLYVDHLPGLRAALARADRP